MSLFPTAVTSPSIPSFPPRNPSENDFSDAYVKFIFACNPQIPIPLSRSMATSARLHGLLESTPRFKSDLPLYPYSLYTIAKEEDSLHIGQDWDWVGLVSRLDIVTSATRKDQHAIDTFAEKVKVRVQFCGCFCLFLSPSANVSPSYSIGLRARVSTPS